MAPVLRRPAAFRAEPAETKSEQAVRGPTRRRGALSRSTEVQEDGRVGLVAAVTKTKTTKYYPPADASNAPQTTLLPATRSASAPAANTKVPSEQAVDPRIVSST